MPDGPVLCQPPPRSTRSSTVEWGATYGPILGINQDFRRWTGYEECFQVLSLARRVAQEPDGIRIDTYEPAPDHVGVLKVQIIEQIVYVQNCEPVVQVLQHSSSALIMLSPPLKP